MVGTISVKVAAHNPNFPLEPVYVFVNSAQSFRILNVPKKIGKWDITEVFVNVYYPDNTVVAKECVLNGSVWVGTVSGCATSGTSTNGFVVSASGIDEDGNVVSNYVLGAGDLYVQQLDGTISPETTAAKMYFFQETPTSPKVGDATFVDGVFSVWNGEEWVASVDTSDKRDKLDLTVYEQTRAPFVYRFKNQDGEQVEETYVWKKIPPFEIYMWWEDTEFQSLAGKLKYEEGRGWLFGSGIGPMSVISTEPEDALVVHNQNVPDWTFTRQSIYEIAPTEDTLAKKSELPTKTSDLTNDSGFITSADVHGDYIEDANGNKIEADRTVQYIEEVANWTDIYYPDNPLNWDAENNWWRADLGPSFYMTLQYNSGTWTLEFNENIGGEWVVNSDSVQDTQDATELHFSIAGANHTLNKGVQQIQTTGELALKSDLPTKTSDLTNDSGFVNGTTLSTNYYNKTEIDGMIGDINSVLDAINGEVI